MLTVTFIVIGAGWGILKKILNLCNKKTRYIIKTVRPSPPLPSQTIDASVYGSRLITVSHWLSRSGHGTVRRASVSAGEHPFFFQIQKKWLKGADHYWGQIQWLLNQFTNTHREEYLKYTFIL